MAQMVGKTGKVIGIDHIKGLVDLSKENILKKDKYLLDEARVKLLFADGWDGCKSGMLCTTQLNCIIDNLFSISVPETALFYPGLL